jgi:signal transduction histidine kinase
MVEKSGERIVGDSEGDGLQSLRKQVLRASLNVLAFAVPGISPKEDLVARLDPNDLERALLNLVLNARDAMPSAGRIGIRCARKAVAGDSLGLPPGRYVEISVSDSGQGMAPETLEHIFEPFFTTKSAGAGSGLGLATVHAFAKACGGNLTVGSTVGVGTTFTMLLPESAEDGVRADGPDDLPAAARELTRVSG